MKITFVRHTAVDVEPGVCYGRTDVPVKESFPQEAAIVRKILEKTVEETGEEFDAVYRSPLSRCRKLADACGYPNAIPDERLYEMDFGEWEMQKYDEITDPRLQQWFEDWMNVSAPGGESFADQNRRVASFIDDMKKSGFKNVLAFTHAGVMMNAMLLYNLATTENMFSLQPVYGSLLTIEV